MNWLKGRAFFGITFVPRSEYENLKDEADTALTKKAEFIARIHELERDVQQRKAEVRKLIDEVIAVRSSRPPLDVFVGDPAPLDAVERKAYVAQVGGLHKDVLEPKLKQMISKAFLLLEDSTNDRPFDQAVKGTIYALREMLRWGESMANEHVANQVNFKEDAIPDRK